MGPIGAADITAADVISAQITDRGLEVSNRTPFRIRVEIELGSSPDVSPKTSQLLRFQLEPRDAGLISPSSFGAATALELPSPVVRHWSHETSTVYQGGTLQLRFLRAVFLDLQGREIGIAERPGGLGLGVFLTASDIRSALAGA